MNINEKEETIDITSLIDFLSSLQKLNTSKSTEVYFRGQNQSYGNTLPGIYRPGLLKHEEELFRSFLVRDPVLFNVYSDGNTNFDRLALMQHHGLPTRLLDLTRNPLVALFFAVSGENQHSGEVVLFSNRLNKDYLSELPIVEQQTLTTLLAINESHPVSALQVVKSVFSDQIEVESSLVRLPLSAKEDITKVLNKLYAKPKDEWIHLFELASSSTRSMIDGFDENRPVVKLYHEIRRDIHDFTTDIDPLAFLVPKIVTPRVIDNRIKNQQGLFLFTPFVDTSLTGFEQATQNRLNLLRVTNGSKMVRFSIPCDSKADILAELAQCGITEDFIYPDHSHIASSIKDKFTTTENE